jgi:hypothetical protein
LVRRLAIHPRFPHLWVNFVFSLLVDLTGWIGFALVDAGKSAGRLLSDGFLDPRQRG